MLKTQVKAQSWMLNIAVNAVM